jgi:hypothetical protein
MVVRLNRIWSKVSVKVFHTARLHATIYKYWHSLPCLLQNRHFPNSLVNRRLHSYANMLLDESCTEASGLTVFSWYLRFNALFILYIVAPFCSFLLTATLMDTKFPRGGKVLTAQFTCRWSWLRSRHSSFGGERLGRDNIQAKRDNIQRRSVGGVCYRPTDNVDIGPRWTEPLTVSTLVINCNTVVTGCQQQHRDNVPRKFPTYMTGQYIITSD